MNEDRRFIEKTLRGEKKAFEMLIIKYQNAVYNYIGRMVSDRELALDFTQDVFIKAYSSLKLFKPAYRFNTWLFKIASNYVIDHWRKKKISPFSLDQPINPDDIPLSNQIPDKKKSHTVEYELSQMRERIEKNLELLPSHLKELFILRHINEFSYEEISEIKSLPLGTVKNRVFQAKEMIRSKLEAEP